MKIIQFFLLSIILTACGTASKQDNEEDLLDIIVEIPAGTIAKWEVNKDIGKLEWEMKDGKKRIIQYLGYPANYGMIPETLLREEDGGDGDPLDVILLGPAMERGTTVKAKLIGMLYLTDSGEKDDKLIAVSLDGPFEKIESIFELNQAFPGVTDILRIWFTSYKGPGVLVSDGYGTKKEAETVLQEAREAFLTTSSTN